MLQTHKQPKAANDSAVLALKQWWLKNPRASMLDLEVAARGLSQRGAKPPPAVKRGRGR